MVGGYRLIGREVKGKIAGQESLHRRDVWWLNADGGRDASDPSHFNRRDDFVPAALVRAGIQLL